MLNDVVSKFGRNFDQISTPQVWSKLGRSLVSQFGRHVIKCITYFIDIPSKLRPNFDTWGVEVWSKFGRSLVEVWSKFGRSLVEVWSKFRHWGCRSLVHISTKFDPPVSKCGLIDDDRNNNTIAYVLKKHDFGFV